MANKTKSTQQIKQNIPTLLGRYLATGPHTTGRERKNSIVAALQLRQKIKM